MSRYAYSDGSKEDIEYYAMKAIERRKQMSAEQVVKKLIDYMEQQLEVLEMDSARLKKLGDRPGREMAVERMAWVEGMILFVNHNI